MGKHYTEAVEKAGSNPPGSIKYNGKHTKRTTKERLCKDIR